MHHLTNLSRLYYQGCLHTLTHGNEIVVDGAHGEQRRNGRMVLVDGTVGEDDVVVALVDTVLGFVAEVLESLVETFLAKFCLEDDRQLDGVESLISDVAQNVELGVR